MKFLPTILCSAALTASLFGVANLTPSVAQIPLTATNTQSGYASAQEAVDALIDAVTRGDQKQMERVLGRGSKALVESGDQYADAESRKHFLSAYNEKHALVADSPDHLTLNLGADAWPLPIPIVESGGRWSFDAKAGAQELVNRRIGRNELAAIQLSLAYVVAQNAYFAQTKAGGGPGEYAQHLMSSPDRHDGLYWPAAENEPKSPLDSLVEQAETEGYPSEATKGHMTPYQGYYFRILKARGSKAPGGPRSYMEGSRMTQGFAMVAWPAAYRSSGVMTFLVDQDGIVFQKDLGTRTAAAAAGMTAFDVDITWARVDVVGN